MGGLRFCHINKLGFQCGLMPRFCFLGGEFFLVLEKRTMENGFVDFMELFCSH
jgi:hypothetical protein